MEERTSRFRERLEGTGGSLACPVCHGDLAFQDFRVSCGKCGTAFPQPARGPLDLRPPEFEREREGSEDEERQRYMEEWYDALMDDPAEAGRLLTDDYEPHAGFLSSLSGSVLDLGGGVGVPREFLSGDCSYLVVEPSLLWLDDRWKEVAPHLPALATHPPFVRGFGEALPIRSASQDAVLVFWTLNHVSSPARVVAEIARVLRPGGRCLLVLEDMIPSRRDVLRSTLEALVHVRVRGAARHAWLLVGYAGREWPLQPDHLRISEAEVAGWASPAFRQVRREWLGGYLTLELLRRDEPSGAVSQ